MVTKVLDSLDHPVVFAIFMTMVVLSTAAIIKYAGQELNWPGLASYASTGN